MCGNDHLDTLDSKVHMISMYLSYHAVFLPRPIHVLEGLAKQVREHSTVTPTQLSAVIDASDSRFLALILGLGNTFVVTPMMVNAAALLDDTRAMMTLLDQRREGVQLHKTRSRW
jgi:hypothetical protein